MLKVLTLNCQKAYQPNFAIFITELIQNKFYDFILLQEADRKVQGIISPLLQDTKYNQLGVVSHTTGQRLNICILYKKEFKFLRSDFITFTPLVLQETAETGSITGLFKVPLTRVRSIGYSKVIVTVTHLHASYRILARKRELVQVKKQTNHLDPDNKYLRIIGGDFNNLIFGEGKFQDYFMRPEFINATDFCDYTCDTKYLEDKYSRFTIGRMFFNGERTYKSKIDHIYINSDAKNKVSYESGVLDVHASDHRPVYLTLTAKRKKIR